MDEQLAARIRANPKFAELLRKRNSFAWTLTIVMLVVYLGFIGVVAYAPDVLGISVSGAITLGFPLGLGVIVVAVLLTGIYVARANGEFDRLTREIVDGAETRRDIPLGTRAAAGAHAAGALR
jgi:uncharacterized membrane protein (DUF485 family)